MTATTERAPAGVAVESRLLRALAVLRVVVLVNAAAVLCFGSDDLARPVAAGLCVVGMAVWTAVATWAYAAPARRTPWLLGADLTVALALLLVSPWVKGEGMQATVPGFWVMAALLAWAVRWRWVGGLVAGACLAVADVAVRPEVTQANYGNVFLLLVGGAVVGSMVASLQDMATARDLAQRQAAAAAERARLARAVHDGVLQVLALVQRRGAELGGAAADLGRLAGEQEVALRSLVRQGDALPPAGGVALERDLAAELAGLESRRPVTVAVPGEPVVLPAAAVGELVAVVEACLDNVDRHVGPQAPAWVLLESLPGCVRLSVRDEGPGIPAGRLAAAEREGRLGVVASIRGRVADLGGTATLSTGSWGTEWELDVPTGGRTLAS